ncbi:SulP family inorganic anion transporter [Paenibacillus woosongensis]|uniref:Sodium-independent anion transporter n=1 Tax=Paenibacillus woosongensis TaxID=307580 RepID=A0ABQ4MWR3_9BACL|nr:SulP family inorganic anion transporter [Paenibacillus woosongensis]GIP60370.1 sodium-independent anion transporter [Paenibacillus woosongensis]
MFKTLNIRAAWFSNIRADLLSGLTVAFALIPEAIAFSLLAGVSPMVGLYASFFIAVVIAFAGGRPGMISAATGAMALLMGGLVRDYGIEYLFAATILAGVIQIILGALRLGKLITFLPHSVMVGFVNALAILIFMAQLHYFAGEGWVMYALVALTLVIIYVFPRMTKAFPSALAAIIIVSVITMLLGLDVKTVGDMGTITSALPVFHLPEVGLSWDMLKVIFPVSLSLAVVGLLESLMTATLIDEITDTPSDKNREMKGQGLANIITGFFGGMAGCAMIGQSMINVKSGGRTRLSTLVSGVGLLFLIIVLGDVVKEIPMAALVGVMFMVCIGTFDWGYIRSMRRKIPYSEGFVMVVTVAAVVATNNLSIGVGIGVLLSALIFAWRMAKIRITSEERADFKQYTVKGQMFFGTVSGFLNEFDVSDDPKHIVIDFTGSHVWDHSAVQAISKVIAKYQEQGKKVQIVGLNSESSELVDRVGLFVPGEQG